MNFVVYLRMNWGYLRMRQTWILEHLNRFLLYFREAVIASDTWYMDLVSSHHSRYSVILASRCYFYWASLWWYSAPLWWYRVNWWHRHDMLTVWPRILYRLSNRAYYNDFIIAESGPRHFRPNLYMLTLIGTINHSCLMWRTLVLGMWGRLSGCLDWSTSFWRSSFLCGWLFAASGWKSCRPILGFVNLTSCILGRVKYTNGALYRKGLKEINEISCIKEEMFFSFWCKMTPGVFFLNFI